MAVPLERGSTVFWCGILKERSRLLRSIKSLNDDISQESRPLLNRIIFLFSKNYYKEQVTTPQLSQHPCHFSQVTFGYRDASWNKHHITKVTSAGETSLKTSAYGIISHCLSRMAITSKLPVVDTKLDRSLCPSVSWYVGYAWIEKGQKAHCSVCVRVCACACVRVSG